jgi:hypothetical protein
MDERNSQYELQPSRNGLTVPVINGVYLHSIYNPIKEAEAFVGSQKKNLTFKNSVLILGLGFGYHVEEAAKILNSVHKSYEIIILEPNERLVEDFIASRAFEDKNIKIICKQKVKELFSDWNFVQFLMKKPCIIKHDASFILEKDFFTNFLGFQASKDIINYKGLLSEDAKNLFQTRDSRNFDSYVEEIKGSGRIIDRNEYLVLALNELRNMEVQGR